VGLLNFNWSMYSFFRDRNMVQAEHYQPFFFPSNTWESGNFFSLSENQISVWALHMYNQIYCHPQETDKDTIKSHQKMHMTRWVMFQDLTRIGLHVFLLSVMGGAGRDGHANSGKRPQPRFQELWTLLLWDDSANHNTTVQPPKSIHVQWDLHCIYSTWQWNFQFRGDPFERLQTSTTLKGNLQKLTKHT